MSQTSHEDEDPVLIEAADWFAKARGPEAARWAPELAAWRQERPDNEAAYARLLQSWERSAFLTHSTAARTRDLRSVSTWSRRPVARAGAIAAMVVLVAGLATIMTRHRASYGPASSEVSFAQTDRVVRTVALADGSRATLDADSAIKIQNQDGAQHIRLIKGRARFEVGPQAAPVVVDTRGGTTESRSGTFDLSVSGRALTVVVWQGTLTVRGNVHSALWSNQMSAGQRLAFDPAAGGPTIGKADPGQLGWTRGMLTFDKTRLADAVAALNRYNSTQIKLSPHVSDLRVTGAFHANDPGGFARVIGEIFGLSQENTADGTIVLSPTIKT